MSLLDDQGIATVTIDGAKSMNIIGSPEILALTDTLARLRDEPALRVLVLRGRDDRAFIGGADIAEMAALAPPTAEAFITRLKDLCEAVRHFPVPVIARLAGWCLGGGLEVAMACDLRLASQSARFAETYAKIGLLPGGGGAWFLPHLVGKAWALELLLAADFIDADTALRIGLVNHIYPDEQLLSQARALAHRMAHMPPLSVRLIKREVNHALNGDMAASFDLISSHIAIAKGGPDHAEAISAFRERREGKYQGY